MKSSFLWKAPLRATRGLILGATDMEYRLNPLVGGQLSFWWEKPLIFKNLPEGP